MGNFNEKDRPSSGSKYIDASNSDHKYTRSIYNSSYFTNYPTKGGIWDLPNLLQFTPYESGYCLLGVISSPRCMRIIPVDMVDKKNNPIRDENGYVKKKIEDDTRKLQYNTLLNEAFVKMLEMEFKGLDGIDDITADTIDISDNISTMSLISKINQQSNGTITMRFTEKSGSLITKYISTYLKIIRDPRSRAKTYGGKITNYNIIGGANAGEDIDFDPGIHQEVFNFLYIVTDSTCLRVEKAFLLLNAQPTTAAYGELYNVERGNIEAKELTVPFTAYVVDGKVANRLGQEYVTAYVNLAEKVKFDDKTINLNSNSFGYTISGVSGNSCGRITDISFSL